MSTPTWLNDELPEEWPDHSQRSYSEFKSGADTSILNHLEGTVAIQKVPANVPQWRQVLSPRRSQHGDVEIPASTYSAGFGKHVKEASSAFLATPAPKVRRPLQDFVERSGNSSSSLFENSSQDVDGPKLVVFGDKNTYTQEKMAQFVSSLGQRGDTVGTSFPGSISSGNTVVDTFAHRKSNDVAAEYLKNGQNVLSRMRKASMMEMQPKNDESLDDLARQLAEGTIATTDASNSNGSTLSTLSSNWDSSERAAPNSTYKAEPQRAEERGANSIEKSLSSLAILDHEAEEHDLETKPSMSFINNANESSDAIISTSQSSREAADLEPHRRAPLPPRKKSGHAQAFDVTFREGSIREPILPNIEPRQKQESSLDLQNATFSKSMLSLLKVLGHENLEKQDEIDLSGQGLDNLKTLNKIIPQVRILNLSRNAITVLQGLPSQAVTMDLSFNQLNRLSLFPLANITTLNIAHNKLANLDGLKNLRSLTHLDASHNSLRSLSGLQHLTVLETLNVENNNLASIVIAHKRLRVLWARANGCKGIRLSTPLLKELYLDDNELTTIEAIPSLEQLHIRNNGASLDFKGWESLEQLHYDGNSSARNFGDLAPRILSWQGSVLVGFDERALRDCHELILAGNIDMASFKGAYPVQELSLCNAGLKTVPEWLPERFPLLRSLNLAFNQLDDQSLHILGRMPHLQQLSLFHNHLRRTDAVVQSLRRLRNLQAVDLRSNPICQNVYPDILFDAGQAPMTIYDTILEMDWPSMVRDWVKTKYDSESKLLDYQKHFAPLGLVWLDGLERSDEREPLHSSTIPSTPSKDMTAFGLSTPSKDSEVQQFVTTLVQYYEMACKERPDLYGPTSKYYVK